MGVVGAPESFRVSGAPHIPDAVFGPPRDNFFDNLEKLTPATDKNKTFPSSRSIHPSHSIGYTFLTQVLTTGFYISVTIPQVQAANFLTVFHDNFLLF